MSMIKVNYGEKINNNMRLASVTISPQFAGKHAQ